MAPENQDVHNSGPEINGWHCNAFIFVVHPFFIFYFFPDQSQVCIISPKMTFSILLSQDQCDCLTKEKRTIIRRKASWLQSVYLLNHQLQLPVCLTRGWVKPEIPLKLLVCSMGKNSCQVYYMRSLQAGNRCLYLLTNWLHRPCPLKH